MYHRNPKMQFKAPKASHLKSEIEADATLEGLAETHRTLNENILEAQQRQTKYTGGNEIRLDIGEKVLLSTKHFRTTRPSIVLDYKRVAPYTVSKVINRNAHKLDLPKQCGTTTFSTCHSLIDTHLQSEASRRTILDQ